MNSFNFFAMIGVSLILVGGAYSAEEESCVCGAINQPVCGSDGITYSNLCKLNCAAEKNKCISKFSDKECQDDCICATVVQYVCASDGKTYQNECQLKCAARKKHMPCLKKVKNGKC